MADTLAVASVECSDLLLIEAAGDAIIDIMWVGFFIVVIGRILKEFI